MSLSEHINVLAEFERSGVAYEHAGDDEIKTLCPFHDDSSPSCHVNVKKRVFKCHVAGCERDGDIVTFLSQYLKITRSVLQVELAKRYGIEDTKIIDASVVEQCHMGIWGGGPLLQALRDRAVTDAMIRRHRIGIMDDRVSIPVPGESGMYVNIRRYLPGAPGKEKMRNMRGCGKQRLFPVDQLRYDRILWCGGELKAIVAIEELNSHGIGAISMTGGEGNFDVALLQKFVGKSVYVCLDIDRAGRLASGLRCLQFHGVASEVYDIVLPLDTNKYPKGDINDYVKIGGLLLPLVEAATPWEPANVVDESEPEDMDLTRATHADMAKRRVRVRGMVSSMDTAPYVVPHKVLVKCDRSQDCCSLCPAFVTDSPFEVPAESPAILQMVSTNKASVREGVMEGVGIPRTCKVCDFDVADYYNVEDVRLSPQLEVTSRSADRAIQPAMCIGKGIELNEGYVLTGKMHPHPKTQQSTLLISSYEPTQDALSTYQCRDIEALEQFCPDEWSSGSIQKKLDEIYGDFEANVTRIFQRRSLHLLMDLAYHSPLNLPFDGRVEKGWVEVLVVGDSGHGKSAVACGSSGPGGLMAHYRLGEKVECKNASVAGLLGGLQKQGERFFVQWGVIPTHDRRLVILEELKGCPAEVFAKCTDMRSSGVAQLEKIEKRRAPARTRLIVNSNSLSGHPAQSYNYGIEIIRELIPGMEDIRRFDACMVINANEVDTELLNKLQSQRVQHPHTYTGDLCRSLVLWGWTRSVKQVEFVDDATSLCMESATRLSARFTDAIPVVDRGSARLKVARLAAALACRTFSRRDETLLVRPCHVEYVTRWLEGVYGSDAFGYSGFTAAMAVNESLVDIPLVKKALECVPFPADFMKHCLHQDKIDLTDIQDWCGWERQESQELLSLMVRKHAFRRDGRSYRKTPPFIRLIKDLLSTNGFVDRPAYVREEKARF